MSGAVLRRWGPPTLLLALLVAIWQMWVVLADTPAYVLPSPGRIVRAFFESAPLLPDHVLATGIEAVSGLVLGAAVGGMLAVVVVSAPLARRTLEPLLVASQTIPMIVLAPLLALWFGIGATPKILVVALITFFPVAVSTTNGLTSADPELLDLVRSMGAGQVRVRRTVRIPPPSPPSSPACASPRPMPWPEPSSASWWPASAASASSSTDPVRRSGSTGSCGRRPHQRRVRPAVRPHRYRRSPGLALAAPRPHHQGAIMKRLILLSTAAVLTAAVAIGCGTGGGSRSAGGDGGRDKITVVLDWTPNTNHGGIYLAEAEGWYRRAGLDVTIIEPGDAGALQLLGSGRADVAFTAQEELVPARAEGVPVVAIAAAIQHNTSSLLSLAGSAIRTPADLAGHTYGGFGGPLEKALVTTLVECSGGDPSEVRFAEVGDVDYRVGLEKEQYDFVWIFDGWDKIRLAELEQVDVSTIPFIDHRDCIPDWYTPMLAATESGIEERAGVLERFMEVTARGYRTSMAQPGAAADALLAAVPELDADLVRRSATYLSSRYADEPDSWGRQDGAVWRRFVAFLADAGLIDDEIDVTAAFTNRFLPDADDGSP
ncbi:MAG: ABC transporter permease/substrate-binding protein [Acidimicrobiales bacterium]